MHHKATNIDLDIASTVHAEHVQSKTKWRV